MKLFLRNCCLPLAVIVAATGCSSLQPVAAGRTVRGIPADHASIIVPKAIIGRQQDLRLDLPACTCTPFASDDKGIYFKADKQVSIRSWVVIVPKFVDGGIFVPDDSAQPCKPFYVYEGTPCPVQKAQESVGVDLVDSATKRRVVLRVE